MRFGTFYDTLDSRAVTNRFGGSYYSKAITKLMILSRSSFSWFRISSHRCRYIYQILRRACCSWKLNECYRGNTYSLKPYSEFLSFIILISTSAEQFFNIQLSVDSEYEHRCWFSHCEFAVFCLISFFLAYRNIPYMVSTAVLVLVWYRLYIMNAMHAVLPACLLKWGKKKNMNWPTIGTFLGQSNTLTEQLSVVYSLLRILYSLIINC